jgi:hypothetical protein
VTGLVGSLSLLVSLQSTEPVTRTLSVVATSAARTTYELLAPPAIGEQEPPSNRHCSHWYAKPGCGCAAEVVVQPCVDAVRVEPTRGLPKIRAVPAVTPWKWKGVVKLKSCP